MVSTQEIFIDVKPVNAHGLKTFLIIQNLNGGLVSLVPNVLRICVVRKNETLN